MVIGQPLFHSNRRCADGVERKQTTKKQGETNSMKTKVLWLSLILSFMVMTPLIAQAPKDLAPEGYDKRTTITEPGLAAGTSLIQDLDEIKQRVITSIINRIRKGDPNVLKYVVYDVFQEVHKEILRQSRPLGTDGKVTGKVRSYYEVIGGKAALPSFYGCFDNQDPKVRLRCIGYLGDWIDDIGINMPDISKQAYDRLQSGIETRIEVYYGLVLLRLKVLRKVVLNNIWNGDEEELRKISAENFVVLVHDEPFIREMYCIPRDVLLRSIRLLQWWLEYYPNMGGIIWYRSEAAEQQERTRTDMQTSFRSLAKDYYGYWMKLYPAERSGGTSTLIYRNWGGYPTAKVLEPGDREKGGYGYRDQGGYNDIASLYDLRYFRYSNDEQLKKGQFYNEEKYLRAIFAGLENTSLFVRENCARLIVRLSDGPVGFMQRENPNYGAFKPESTSGTDFVAWDSVVNTSGSDSRAATPYETLNDTNDVVGVQGRLSEIAKNAKYQTIINNAWRDVRFAQFMDVHERSRFGDGTLAAGTDRFQGIPAYDINDGINTYRNAPFRGIHNSWGYKYNYRTDIADIMRRFGLHRTVGGCEKIKIEAGPTVGESGTYFVEDLFDLDDQDRPATSGSPVSIPLWHGKDEIKDEVFEP
jgi:hypothetical protein